MDTQEAVQQSAAREYLQERPEVRHALAKAAREEAYSIAERGAPESLDNTSWCLCGLGHVMHRAGLTRVLLEDDADLVMTQFLDDLGGVSLTTATARELNHRDGALVFPLLALADALDESWPQQS